MDVAPSESKPTSEGVRLLRIASDDETVLSSAGSLIRLWNLRSGKQNQILKGHKGLVHWCEFTSDIRFVASCGEDTSVRLWSVRKGECIHLLRARYASVQCSFTPDNRKLICCSEDDSLMIYDVTTGDMLRKLHGHTDYISGFRVTNDGRSIVSWSMDHTVKKWSIFDGRSTQSFTTDASITFCCLTSDARYVLTNDSHFGIGVWNSELSRRASGSVFE